MQINHYARAALIGAAIRRQMQTVDWPWRYAEIEKIADLVERAAIARLQTDARRARTWVQAVADAIGLPIPVGNGINGPWQRVAVIARSGVIGVADIACGRIAWTDCEAPAYVQRFSTRGHRLTSPNEAGGSGGLPDGARQVMLVYGGTRCALKRAPRPQVTRIEYGLSTCYGYIGCAPTADEYRPEWARLVASGVPCVETATPQRMEVLSSVDPDTWDAYREAQPYGRLRGVSRSGRTVRVTGMPADRAEAAGYIERTWPVYVRSCALDAAAELLACNGVRVRAHDHLRGEQLLYARRALAQSLMPATGLTEGQEQEVSRIAAELLARDPSEVGLLYRDPWGRPGYPDGGNHISYVCPPPLYAHVIERPGVSEWLTATRRAAADERLRIGYLGTGGPVTDDDVSRIRAAGYDVTVLQHGRISAVVHTLDKSSHT